MTQFVVENASLIIIGIICLVYCIACSRTVRGKPSSEIEQLTAANFSGDPDDSLFYQNKALNTECNNLMAKNKDLRAQLRRALEVVNDQPPILTEKQSNIIFQENGRLRDRIEELEQELSADQTRRRIAYHEFRRMEKEIAQLRIDLDKARDGIRA